MMVPRFAKLSLMRGTVRLMCIRLFLLILGPIVYVLAADFPPKDQLRNHKPHLEYYTWTRIERRRSVIPY